MNVKDITDVFDKYGVEYRRHGEHHHTTRGWVSSDCPNCSAGFHKFRLGWELGTGRVSCWQCGKTDPVVTLCKLCSIQFGQALEYWLAVQKGEYVKTEDAPTGTLRNPIGLGPLQPQHKRYLTYRGLDPDEVERTWHVQGIGIHAKMPWRLFIPIYDRLGRQVSWTTRSISDKNDRRYVTASVDEEALSLKHVLYGAEHALNTIIVVEGPLDAWAIGPGGVATCGVAFSDQQLGCMIRYPVRVVCFDREPDAQRRATALCRELSQYPGVTQRVMLESGDDPSSADPGEIDELRGSFLRF